MRIGLDLRVIGGLLLATALLLEAILSLKQKKNKQKLPDLVPKLSIGLWPMSTRV